MSNFKDKSGQSLSGDPNTAMQEMMNSIDALRRVYVRETEALQVSDVQAFLAIQEQKIAAARACEAGAEEIIARKEEMKNANPLLKRRLEDLQKEFAELSEKNLDAVSRMQRVTERVGNVIRRAAKDAVDKQRAFSYGETGALSGSSKRSISTGLSETA